jgi:hypothetical protein
MATINVNYTSGAWCLAQNEGQMRPERSQLRSHSVCPTGALALYCMYVDLILHGASTLVVLAHYRLVYSCWMATLA